MSNLKITGLVQSGWVRNAHVGCAALVIYEHLLQFDNEVDLFWKRRWTLAKFLFLWCRYLSIILNVADAIVFLHPKPSHNMYVITTPLLRRARCPHDDGDAYDTGTKFLYWQNAGAATQVVVTHIILQLRLFAMYGSPRKMLFFFFALTTSEVIVLSVIGTLGIQDPKRVRTNEPFPDVFICANQEPGNGHRWVAYYYTIVILVEGGMLWLALRKAWMYRPAVGGFSLMQKLTRDSAVYFFIIFSVYLANLIIWVYNHIILNELGVPFAFAFSSIFANRLLIGVRVAYYGSYFEPEDSHGTIHIRFTSEVTNQQTRDRIELETFNECIGA